MARQRTWRAPLTTWQGNLDKDGQEAAEVHRQEASPLLVVLLRPALVNGQQQGTPGLYAPGEGGHHHVGPVGHERVDRGVQHPTWPFSWAIKFSWLQRERASATTWWAVISQSLVI